MKIQNTGIDFHRSDLTKGVQGGEAGAKKPPVQPVAPVQRERGDSVQISDAGRALAAQRGEAVDGARSTLSAERISEIRQRILQGAYNSTEVVEEVARRMLERGDI